ncbi:MAG TPA: GntR family transcriptional regulator [Firmicutes bacterium]|jgi:DNA-binding transcriptional regulator YhcF (GntR family)|nr:GntR family transcriptional regulator [Bacillota bacterium]
MIVNFDSGQPIYIQLAEAIEDDILKGIMQEETQVPSTTEISVALKINPATARKGVNMLVDEGILYKRRGVGMFVSVGAREKVMRKRRAEFYESFVVTLLDEAEKLNISQEELVEMIERGLPNE